MCAPARHWGCGLRWDEATRVAERQLKVDAKEWWANMGRLNDAEVRAQNSGGA